MTLVMKFGGTSVGSADAMRRTAELIKDAKEKWGQVVVVASGMGSKPIKVTDLLLNGSQAAVKGKQETIEEINRDLLQIHVEAIDGLIHDEERNSASKWEIGQFVTHYDDLCRAIRVLGEISPRASDAIGGMGEQMSVRILAAYLNEIGFPARAIDATDLIVTDDNFTDATPLIAETNAKTAQYLAPLLGEGVTPIVTGFIGATVDGITTTLGRGGSDYSASIIGRALQAKEVWIWTDVDGVMSSDPRVVPDARTIPELTYREVSELAYYGAKVIHPRTMRPLMGDQIPLRIKNTFNPDHPGTVVVRERKMRSGAIRAVTAIKALSLVTVEGRGMLGVPGVAARTFKAVADLNASVLLITQSSSEQSICFSIPTAHCGPIVASLESEFKQELASRDIDRIFSFDDVAILTAVGAGMKGIPGVCGQLCTALGNANINIIAISQGSSECGISVVISEEDVPRALQVIHALTSVDDGAW